MPTVAEQIKAIIEEYRDIPQEIDLDKVVAEVIETATKDMYKALKAWDNLREVFPLGCERHVVTILQECSEITDKALGERRE